MYIQKVSSTTVSFKYVKQENFRAVHIRKSDQKENLHTYLLEKIPFFKQYFEQLPQSTNESDLSQKILFSYLLKRGFTYEDSLPLKANVNLFDKHSPHSFFSETDLKSFTENGVIGPKKIKSVSQEKLRVLDSRFAGILNMTDPGRLKMSQQEWRDPDVLDLATNEEILEKVSFLLGSNVKIRATNIHTHPPGKRSISSMTTSQASDFYAHSTTNLEAAVIPTVDTENPFCDKDAITVWVSIAGTDKHNSPLFVFPGTHKWDIMTPLTYLDHAKEDREALLNTCKLLATQDFGNHLNANHYLFYNYLLTSQNQFPLKKTMKTNLLMQPGDCVIFSSHLLHGLNLNTTFDPRLGISIQYSQATNEENHKNLTLVNSSFTRKEQLELGLDIADERMPSIQVSGNEFHVKSKPIDLAALKDTLRKKL